MAAALAIAACTSGGEDEPASTATTIPSATSATLPATTGSTAAPGPACPGPPIGAEIAEVSGLDADVDGDGALDVVTSYLAPEQWRLRVDLADGGSAEAVLPTAPLDVATVAAAVDLDGDGGDELWVEVGRGASTTIVGLYAFERCALGAVSVDGADAQFSVGGPVLLLQGVRCEGGRVVHLGATSEDGETFATLDLAYELQDGALVRVEDRSGTLTSDDPELQAYSSFAC